VAAIREVDWRRFEPNFFAVFPEGPLDAAPRTYVTLTRVEQAQDRSRLQRRVLESYPNATVLDLSQIQQAIELVLSRVTLAVRFMALFSLATGAVVLLGAVATSRYQRLKEGVVLKTLGATRNQVARVLLAEYLSLGTLAAASAFGLATAAGWALQRFRFETSFVVPLVPMGALAAGVVALTVAVGFWSSWDVARRPALEVLRAE
jgi:putative ABC transport system permease protein